MSPELMRLLVAAELERIKAETPQPVAEEAELAATVLNHAEPQGMAFG